MWENVVYGVGGWIGGILTLIITRYLRKDHITEGIAQLTSMAALMEKLKAMGVSIEEANAAVASLDRGWFTRKGKKQPPLSLEDQIEKQEWAEIEVAKSQQEMNSAAQRRFARLEQRMEVAYSRLRRLVGDDLVAQLDASQDAWKKFRDMEAEFAGAPWGNGTMRPFIVAGAMSHVTKSRAGDLEAKVAEYSGIHAS